jgi:hypothetical protein
VTASDPYKTHKHTVWENVKPGGTYSNHWALKGSFEVRFINGVIAQLK